MPPEGLSRKVGAGVVFCLVRKALYPAKWSHGGKRFVCLFGAKAPSRHFHIGDEMSELLNVHTGDVLDCDICFSLFSSKAATLDAVEQKVAEEYRSSVA